MSNSISIFRLFGIIDRAKSVFSHAIAYTAFAVLLDRALKDETGKLQLVWQSAHPTLDHLCDDSIVIRCRSMDETAYISIAFLKNPMTYQLLCKAESKVEYKQEYDLSFSEERLKQTLQKLIAHVLEIEPNAQQLVAKYLMRQKMVRQDMEPHSRSQGECLVCLHQDGIESHCSRYPKGYPENNEYCPDWEIDDGFSESWRKINFEQTMSVFNSSKIETLEELNEEVSLFRKENTH